MVQCGVSRLRDKNISLFGVQRFLRTSNTFLFTRFSAAASAMASFSPPN
jgi:hypothetical protein